MIDHASLFLAKALESLAGAESELMLGRFNNSANRTYYAYYQVAIAALLPAHVRPPGGGDSWSHSFVGAQFDGPLINRHKLYGTELRSVVGRNHLVRLRADYEQDPVSQSDGSKPGLAPGSGACSGSTGENGGGRVIARETPLIGPEMQAAINELMDRILARYPGTTFRVTASPEEHDAVHLKAVVDVDDTDNIIDRMMELQIEDGLPIYVAPVRTPARRAAVLAAETGKRT